MYAFDYSRPASLDEAVKRLAADDEAMLLAGGMTLIPSMKHRLAAPSSLLDISRLPELQGIDGSDHELSIGAATTHAALASSPTVRAAIPALAELASQIGDPQVRVRGTLGGSLANSDPAADYPAAALGLQATIHTHRRAIAADDFFLDMFTTALEPGEILQRVTFRRPRAAAYAKFHHPASGYAMTGVFVARLGDAVRVGVTGAGPCAFRWTAAETALQDAFAVASLDGLQHAPDGLNADMHAPAEYRANLIAVLTRRAVQACEAN